MGTLTPTIFQARDKTIVVVFPTQKTAPELRRTLEGKSWAHPHTWGWQSKYRNAYLTLLVPYQHGPDLRAELLRARSVIPRDVDFSRGQAGRVR